MAGESLHTAARVRIGDSWQPGALGGYAIVNPANEEPVGEAPEASPEQALDAARAAREAFPAWSRTSADERARLLAAVGDALRERADALVPLIISETGCTARVGREMQVPVAASRFDAYARLAMRSPVIPLEPTSMPATPLAPGGVMNSIARRQALGVVACITPYNFPVVSLAGKLGPALAMGNTVVVRPAPQDPLAVYELVEIFDEVGFPPGVVNFVTGSSPATGEALVESPDVAMVSFTGSTGVGTRIAEVGARTLKRMLLELGGKGAALVLDDADVANAAAMIASTWSFHSGQICTAPTRAIVHRSLFEPVMDALAAQAGALAIGDPYAPDTVVGPVISAQQRDRIEAHVRGAVEEGAELRCGGTRPSEPSRGFYAAPTLVTGGPELRIAREEVFGPVVVGIPFDDDEEGIAIANGTEFGLYDYVFSGDTARAMEVGGRLEAGNVGLNTTQRNHNAPFGGTKRSGIGRDGGEFGLDAYSELQSVAWSS